MSGWPVRVLRWWACVGIGLARSLILLVVSVLYLAGWAVLVLSVWLVAVSVPSGWMWTAVELGLFGGWLCLVVPPGPVCDLLRFLVCRWTGAVVVDGYRPRAPIVRMSTGFWWNGHRYWRSRGRARVSRWVSRRLHDPAAWRDRRALVVAPFGVGVVAAVPLASIAAAAVALAAAGSSGRLLGLVPLAFGIATAPYAWRAAVAVLVRLLQPPARVLSARVRELTEQRADATAAQAAEIRRIERDLHDGAQGRLAALGVNLATAVKVLDRDADQIDLEQVRALLRESIATTSTALRELRELVRGIDPPVLHERGLVDALRALALDSPLRVAVDAEPGPAGRLDPPIEAALYFGVCELLTNVVKHAYAGRVDIRLRHRGGGVVIEVSDDGHGRAAMTESGGLAGLRRRLAMFDGTLSLDSPPGGPTRVTMVVPWTSW